MTIEQVFEEFNEKESKPSTTYHVAVKCSNCNFTRHFDIPKGIKKEEYLQGEICINCRCKFLTKEHKENGNKQQ